MPVCKLQIKLAARTLWLKFAVSVRNFLQFMGNLPRCSDGRKMELPWMVDQMLENARPQRRTSYIKLLKIHN
jgi:hypothetical protein